VTCLSTGFTRNRPRHRRVLSTCRRSPGRGFRSRSLPEATSVFLFSLSVGFSLNLFVSRFFLIRQLRLAALPGLFFANAAPGIHRDLPKTVRICRAEQDGNFLRADVFSFRPVSEHSSPSSCRSAGRRLVRATLTSLVRADAIRFERSSGGSEDIGLQSPGQRAEPLLEVDRKNQGAVAAFPHLEGAALRRTNGAAHSCLCARVGNPKRAAVVIIVSMSTGSSRSGET
jgi:hypothetical protein